MNTELIDTDRISVKFNFRTSFDEAKIKELSQSILKCGVLQPIILRKAGKELVLVAGERRVRAAKLAGLKQIPCRILDLTEEQALEAACIENLHREDLNPMEEARAFKTLMARGAWQVEDIALKVDKSRSYVYRAIRLLDLPEKAQNALADGKISAAHALQLLRLEEKDIETMLEKVLEGDVSARELSREIEWRFGKRLEDVYFPLDKEYAGRGPCRTCMFNSENQQNLFDEALEAGRCMKEDCFKAKKEFFNKELEKEARKEAKAEGFDEIARLFERVAAIEKRHEDRYRKLLSNVEKNEVWVKTGPRRWECRNCGHVYIGEKAPEICPTCKHPKAFFEIEAENY